MLTDSAALAVSDRDGQSSTPMQRHRRSLAEAQELVGRWRASGQNQEAFCRSQGILRSALHSCRRRVGDVRSRPAPDGRQSAGEAAFVQVVGPGQGYPGPAGLVAHTADGIRLEIGDGGSVDLIGPTLAAIRAVTS